MHSGAQLATAVLRTELLQRFKVGQMQNRKWETRRMNPPCPETWFPWWGRDRRAPRLPADTMRAASAPHPSREYLPRCPTRSYCNRNQPSYLGAVVVAFSILEKVVLFGWSFKCPFHQNACWTGMWTGQIRLPNLFSRPFSLSIDFHWDPTVRNLFAL